jgi:hypothetical protein
MKKISLLLFLLFVFSCKKEDVQLAKATISITKDITDYSPVYIFFDVDEKDTVARVNKNNTISTTNWVFNVDKRLPLDLVIPEVIKLQGKKKNSSHKKEGAINVFSYGDTVSGNLAFLPFTDVQYKFDKDFSKFFIKEHVDAYISYHNLTINFDFNNNITVDGNDMERKEFVIFMKDFIDFTSEGKTTILHLNFDKHLTFDQYVQNKILAWQLTSEVIQLSSYEFIYDINKLPECGCKL